MANVTTLESFTARDAAPWETNFVFEKHVRDSGFEHCDMTIRSGNVTSKVFMSRSSLLALADAATRMASRVSSEYDSVNWWIRDGDEIPFPQSGDCENSCD